MRIQSIATLIRQGDYRLVYFCGVIVDDEIVTPGGAVHVLFQFLLNICSLMLSTTCNSETTFFTHPVDIPQHTIQFNDSSEPADTSLHHAFRI